MGAQLTRSRQPTVISDGRACRGGQLADHWLAECHLGRLTEIGIPAAAADVVTSASVAARDVSALTGLQERRALVLIQSAQWVAPRVR
jgi:hypothetical protein